MDTATRDQIRQILGGLAETHAATIQLMEKALALMSAEMDLDPWTFWKSKGSRAKHQSSRELVIDDERFTVSHHGRSCFLGNTISFRLLERLARRPNVYVSHDDLLSDVWKDPRSDDAIRSAVKNLRTKLRKAGMKDLASAIDGSVAGHYVLSLKS